MYDKFWDELQSYLHEIMKDGMEYSFCNFDPSSVGTEHGTIED
jgi:hypothetical protein